MEVQEYIEIEQFHRNEVTRGIPLIFFLIGIGLTGAIGNTLVYLVYNNKYPSSNCRTFVIALSIVDLLTSMIGIPFEIVFVFQEYNMPVWMCKTSLFVNTLPTLTSVFLLLAIAVDRYRKVCKPFSWQISNNAAKLMCLLTVVISLAFSWMQPLVHGIQTRKHAKYNITISECVETYAMKQTVFTWLNTLCFIIVFVGSLTGILIMYCSIAVKVKRHHDRQSSIRSNSIKSGEEKPEVSELMNMPVMINTGNNEIKPRLDKESAHGFCCYSKSIGDGIKNSTEQTEVPDANRTIDSDMNAGIKHEKTADKTRSVLSRLHSLGRSSFSSSDIHPTASRSNSSNQSINIKIKNVRNRNAFRTAYIMFLISLAFVISYLPTLCLQIITTVDDTYVENLTDGSETAYKFFLRSFLMNCACNPVIYGLCDKRFRKHCKTFINKWNKCRLLRSGN